MLAGYALWPFGGMVVHRPGRDAGLSCLGNAIWLVLGGLWLALAHLLTGILSRLRWAATKIGLVSIGVLAMTAIYAGMLTWWITPVMQTSGQRFAYVFFDIHGIVVFGYALFALALRVFAGAVTGRMLPAMATTVVGFLGTRLVVMLAARTRYGPTETRRLGDIVAGVAQMRNDLHGDWIIAANSPDGTYEELTIHPAGDFWAFQAIETAIFVALAVGLVIATIYWIRRRIA